MADSSGGKQGPRGFAIFIELLQEWWQHRVSFLISLVITLTAVGLYVVTYIGEHPSPLLVFMERLELDALDTRFRLRPAKCTRRSTRERPGIGGWASSNSQGCA